MRRWRKTRGGAAAQAALTFGCLGSVAVLGFLTPDNAEGGIWTLISKVVLALVVFFPYFLYRFAAVFASPARIFDRLALGLTMVVVVGGALIDLPEGGATRTPIVQSYIVLLLGQWTLLSVAAALRLWRAGSGQPNVVRRRMRLLALGASAVNVALLLAGLIPSEAGSGLNLFTDLFTTAGTLAFFFGFETPRSLRLAWRRKEEESFRGAVRDVVAANTPTQVAAKLLPQAAAIVGARSVTLLDPEGSVLAAFSEAESAKRSKEIEEEIRLQFANGTLVMTASAYTPFFGEDEVGLVEFLGDLMNIALERSRLYSLHELILHDAGEGIYGLDSEGRVTFMNTSASLMMGWSLGELSGRRMHDVTHHSYPDGSHYPREECPIFKASQDGASHRIDNEVFWRKDGSSFPVEYTSTPVREGEKITGVVVTFADITERKAAQEAMEVANRQLEEAQALAHVGSWEWDLAQGDLAWSEEMYRIYGIPAGKRVTFELVSALTHPEDREQTEASIRSAVASGGEFENEYRIVRPDSQVRTVLAIGRVVERGDGRPAHVIGSVQDITERKKAEEAVNDAFAREREAREAVERANMEMESFVYTVSHDLNSPLVSVSGYLDYLQADYGDSLPEQGRFFLERMGVSTRYMQALIRDLLEFSRVGRLQTEPDSIDLTEVLSETVDQVRSTAPGFKVHLDPLPVVSMNPVRARQLFANLLQNAARYAGESATVNVRVIETVDGRVCLSVADNGPGIPEDQRKRAFEVFQRLSESQSGSGTGIGLAICKRIVENAGGEIWIADSETGTDMRMTLPLVAPARAKASV